MSNILIIAEHDNTELKPATNSCLAAAINLINKTKQDRNIDIFLAGDFNNDNIASKLQEQKLVNKILLMKDVNLAHGIAEYFTDLIAEVASNYEYILLPSTTFGKNIAPRLAAILDVNPLSDIIEIQGTDTFKRPIYAGNAVATVKLHDKIKVLTIRPTCFDLNTEIASNTVSSSKTTQIDNLNFSLQSALDLFYTKFIKDEFSSSEHPELSSAKIVVSGGRGLGSKENFILVDKLADSLGAAVGASRAAVDAGYVPNDYQVGQTGKVVAPDLYIAVGISGAIQHVAGMQESKVIVAINKDPEAAIFKIADYGLVGDLFTILPELTDKISALKTRG